MSKLFLMLPNFLLMPFLFFLIWNTGRWVGHGQILCIDIFIDGTIYEFRVRMQILILLLNLVLSLLLFRRRNTLVPTSLGYSRPLRNSKLATIAIGGNNELIIRTKIWQKHVILRCPLIWVLTTICSVVLENKGTNSIFSIRWSFLIRGNIAVLMSILLLCIIDTHMFIRN